jgi:hypothetical protein
MNDSCPDEYVMTGPLFMADHVFMGVSWLVNFRLIDIDLNKGTMCYGYMYIYIYIYIESDPTIKQAVHVDSWHQ